jgi:hypothetical protein
MFRDRSPSLIISGIERKRASLGRALQVPEPDPATGLYAASLLPLRCSSEGMYGFERERTMEPKS